MPSFLYIEDDFLSRQVMEVILTVAMGYQDLAIFEDSTDYMARIKSLSFTPDVIFLDIHMRPHTGVEILKSLRTEDRYAKSRIVALTASVMNEEVELLKHAGFDGVFAKPLNELTFPGMLGRVLNGEQIWSVL